MVTPVTEITGRRPLTIISEITSKSRNWEKRNPIPKNPQQIVVFCTLCPLPPTSAPLLDNTNQRDSVSAHHAIFRHTEKKKQLEGEEH
jgi:hypothetical protein